MPSALDAPVLQVDANVIHKVDTSNPQNLFSMWTVFARCADSVAQGRRLENLSWRLWTRETFCVDSTSHASPAPSQRIAQPTASAALPPKPTTIPRRNESSTDDMPQLSGSVESLDEETDDLPGESGAVEIVRPRIRRQDSCASSRSRGRERHITSDDLEKMVASIVQGKESLKPLPDITTLSLAAATAAMLAAQSKSLPEHTSESTLFEHSSVNTLVEAASDEQVSQKTEAADEDETETPTVPVKTTTVIRGFSPSHLPIPMPTFTAPAAAESAIEDDEDEDDVLPEPTSSPAAKLVPSKKATFALGGSSSCENSMSDPSQSLEMRSGSLALMMKKKAVASSSNLAGASKAAAAAAAAHPEEDSSLKSAMLSRNLGTQKKQTSFSNQVMTRTIPAAPVFEDDSESDDIDESAIDEDDSDWEDSNEDSGRSSVDDKNMFQRVDSKVHLPSRRSLITLMIQKSENELRNGLTTSQSAMTLSRPRLARQPPSLVASPTDSDDAALTMRQRSRPQSNLRPINEIPRSAAQPIVTQATGGNYQAAYSPRTNRRNMLSTELTESLRRHLLWERSQKTSTANAVLKRRHTSQDVANLRQYPEVAHMNKDNDANASSWDQYLNRDAFNGYHAKGW